MQVGDDTTLEKVEAYYKTLSEAWGFDVRPTPWVLQTLAAKLWDAGRKDEAIQALDWYIARNPNEPLPHGSRGKFLMWQGKHEAALAALRTARDLELAQPVPCGVYLLGFRERIAEAEKLPLERS
jgi:tetratricopeptide (TPR) repeat protein